MNKSRHSNKKVLASQLFQKLITLSKYTDAASMITLFTFRPSEEIYRSGKNAGGVYYVSSGLVKQMRLQETGDEPMVRLTSGREFLGILSLVRGYRFTSTAIAVNNVEAYMISRNFFTKALDTDYEFSYLFLQYLLESIYIAETRISELITKNVEQRIAIALLSLYTQNGTVKKVMIQKKDLAAIAGTIQETISRKLALMAKKKLIKLKGKEIIINDLDGLIRLSKIVN
ncbi:MAG: Crp/Fnr family transcriptional regulator [Bacteroidia bacterium]|nr:Crp/Fnr family transcriptional regulator [Bacteroidia bacterium]